MFGGLLKPTLAELVKRCVGVLQHSSDSTGSVSKKVSVFLGYVLVVLSKRLSMSDQVHPLLLLLEAAVVPE